MIESAGLAPSESAHASPSSVRWSACVGGVHPQSSAMPEAMFQSFVDHAHQARTVIAVRSHAT
jgi:hypothetical protein